LSTLNLDIGIQKPFNDHLDDVSSVYTDDAALAETSGTIAAALADRSGLSCTEGTQRGNSAVKDNHFLIDLKFERILGKKATSCFYDDVPSRSKRKINKHQRNMFSR
jgi:hypothetical protein